MVGDGFSCNRNGGGGGYISRLKDLLRRLNDGKNRNKKTNSNHAALCHNGIGVEYRRWPGAEST